MADSKTAAILASVLAVCCGKPNPAPDAELDDGRLAFQTERPATVAACPASSTCEDGDEDGLVDAWEQEILERFRPLVRLHPRDRALRDPESVIAHVARVQKLDDSPLRVRLYVTILYTRDYGNCGFHKHPGDTERVVLELDELDDGSLILSRLYLAAHEFSILDHSRRLETDELNQVAYAEDEDGVLRWVVYSAKNKHASYVDDRFCERGALPCLEDDCANYDAGSLLLAPVVNAGEPDAPLVESLEDLGYPGEEAWVEQPFCGGLGRLDACPGSVRGKLTIDPFDSD